MQFELEISRALSSITYRLEFQGFYSYEIMKEMILEGRCRANLPR
jgi:hypothetical protein